MHRSRLHAAAEISDNGCLKTYFSYSSLKKKEYLDSLFWLMVSYKLLKNCSNLALMITEDILKDIALGEDSSRQFKVKLNNAQQLAKEMCAMSNSRGGVIYVGVQDNGDIAGITSENLRTYNQWISASANEMIRPAIYPQTRSVEIDGKFILIISISDGVSKPYCDNKGVYWTKSGSDTRNASPQELARMFQASSQITLDETPTKADVLDLNKSKFLVFFERLQGEKLSDTGIGENRVLENMNLAEEGHLTLGGLLLFAEDVQKFKPYCLIRAVAYYGVELSDSDFIDKSDLTGTLDEQYKGAMTFLKRNLRKVPSGPSFNDPAVLEISEQALEESIVNALLHRDYSKNAVIRLLIFEDRVEIISPGSLPNHLTVENVKNGNSVMRNPLLTSFGTKMMPYSGIGSGVPRVFRTHPNTEMVNDVDGEQFTVILKRR